jgi:uncharacterized membrane protein HdeD (DUF308 family)
MTQWTERLTTRGSPREAPVEAVVIEVPLDRDQLLRVRKWLLATGALTILAGAAAILVPAVASVAIATFVGWLLVLAGAFIGAHAWAMRRHAGVGKRAVTAVLALAAGVCILAFPLTGTLTLTFLLAAWFFATGVLLVLEGAQVRGRPGWELVVFNGLLSLLLGFLVAVDLPSSAAWAIGLLVGVNLIFWGVRALIGAQALKRLVAA